MKSEALFLAAALALASAAAIPLIRPKELALYAGPASKPDGLALLKRAVEKLPRAREIVVYCGCCPWDRCPNVRPAIDLLKELGFTRARALYLADSFKTNWIDALQSARPAR